MICYVKGAPPARLTALATTPGMTWDGLGAEDRGPIRTALIRDQGGLCAYCQRPIDAHDDPATGRSQMKIEHWLPRSQSTVHHFIWSNLLGVCLGTSRSASEEPRNRTTHHCDASRGDHKLFLHPVQGQGADPREHLRYTKGGIVESATRDARVEADIQALNLNAKLLVRGRNAVFEAEWKRLARKDFAIGELRKEEQTLRIAPGTQAREHSEFLRYHICKKIRSRGHSV